MRIFLQENVWLFCQATKKVAELQGDCITEVAVRQGFTALFHAFAK